MESVTTESVANNGRVGYEISLDAEEGIAALNEMCTDVSDGSAETRRATKAETRRVKKAKTRRAKKAETRRAKKAQTLRGKKEKTARTEKTY